MKVTISDVARLAGVSTATVSHTINSTRYVSGETKEKVYRAIAELGYTPDASARSFRTGKKKTIGFIVPDISNKFFATMIESVENYLSAHGYHLIIANTKENPEREETNIRLLSAGLVDGLLIASTMEDFSRFESLIPAGFPVVLVDRTFATKERIAAYQEAVADCGLPQDDLLIRYGNSMENSAQSCLDELLEQKCDALVVAQGLMASETVIYLHKKGLKLGEDIDLVTFVDYDSDINYLYSKQMDCIIQPVEKLGETASELILRRIETPDAPAFEQVLTSTYQPCGM